MIEDLAANTPAGRLRDDGAETGQGSHVAMAGS